jgi:uncharacterized protein (DUF362 family)
MDTVLIRSLKGINSSEGLKNLLESAKMMHWLDKLNRKNKVIIKPNLCYIAPWESGVTTNVKLVEYLIDFLGQQNPNLQIIIVESDSHDRKCEDAFEQLGYMDLKEKYNVELLNLTKQLYQEIVFHDLHYSIKIPEIFFEDVFFISIANLKVHSYQKMTCICKNQFGCVPDEIKERYHQYMEETLYALNKCLYPDLSIIDGKIGLEGIGPVTGTPVKADIMLMSNDPIAIDTIAAKIMGLDLKEVPHLQYAFRKERKKPGDYTVRGMKNIPKFEFKTGGSYKLIRLKINLTRFTDSLNKTLKKSAEKIYNFPRFIRRAYGFSIRKLKALVGKG